MSFETVFLLPGAYFGALTCLRFVMGKRVRRMAFGELPREPREVHLAACVLGMLLIADLFLVVGAYSTTRASTLITLAAFGATLGFSGSIMSSRRTVLPTGSFEWFCILAIFSACILAFFNAVTPVTQWDACVAHISLPQFYHQQKSLAAWEGNEYSGYPQLIHILYALLFDDSSRLIGCVSLLFAMLAISAVYQLAARLAPESERQRCGLVAAAMLATAPIFIDQAGVPSIDMPFLAFTLTAMVLILAWRDGGPDLYILLAGVIAGSSCGIRHTGYLVCVLLAVGVVIASRSERGYFFTLFTIPAILGALPWMMRTAYYTGNPFFPFFVEWFPSTFPHDQITHLAGHSTVREVGLLSMLRFPWDIIMRPHEYDGWTKSPGALVLLLGVPGLIVAGTRARWVGAFSIAGGACFYFFQRLARYMLPFFGPMMAVAAVASVRLKPLRTAITILLVVFFVYGLALEFAAVHFKIPGVRVDNDQEYLQKRVERYEAFEWLNENLPQDACVLTLDPRSYYIKRRAYQNPAAIRALCNLSPLEQTAWMKKQGIGWIFVPISYIMESSEHAKSTFGALAQTWHDHPKLFQLVKKMDLPRKGGKGVERVEIYRVRPEVEEIKACP